MGKTLRVIWTWISHLSTGQWLVGLVAPAMTLSAVFKFIAEMPLGLSIAFGILTGLALFVVWQAVALIRQQSANHYEGEKRSTNTPDGNGRIAVLTATPEDGWKMFGRIEPGSAGRLEVDENRSAQAKPIPTIGLHIKGGRGANVDGALIENVHVGVQVENHRNLILKNVTVRGALVGHLFGRQND